MDCMPNYRRYRVEGGTYFFTVNLLERYPNDLLVRHIELLRSVVRQVRERWPFHIDAWVVLPDHLHCLWTLPPGDHDFTNRWRLIKQGFSKALRQDEHRSAVRIKRGERGIWQRRFWEHVIRDDRDYAAHVDYCHINPYKHGYVKHLAEWPYSTFHHFVAQGFYPANWATGTEKVPNILFSFPEKEKAGE
jgi:putative transposase